jgi:hypothetical protein
MVHCLLHSHPVAWVEHQQVSIARTLQVPQEVKCIIRSALKELSE